MHGHSSADQTAATSGRVIHWARLYDAVAFLMLFGREKRLRRRTIELAGVAPGQSVLDVGCGTGTLTLAAKAAVGPSGQVSGIDPAPEMVEVARRKAARAGSDVDFRVGVIEALPFPDTSFDVVLSSLMLHHLPEEVKRKGFEEIARVLRPGGLFFAVDLATGSHTFAGHLLGGLFGHKRHGALESAVQMMEATGFRDVTAGRMKFKLLGFLSGRRA
jgi:demethylmenaquinone methyltransferase/2-methoxy-6-polyprenyl-1,4-benzoquinol methylase/phosphoethanolamine N-methyltransferase